MSYEIIYDKQFVKAEKEGKEVFFPMLLWGSNNCYEWSPSGRERRARSWSVWAYHAGGEFYATKEYLLQSCEDFKNRIKADNEARENDRYYEEFDEKCFGYWSSVAIGGSTINTTFGRYKGIFKTGCEKALTVEQLAEENIHVHVKSYAYKSETYEEQGKDELSEYATSGEELIRIVDEAKEYYKDTGISVHITFCGMYESSMKWIRKKYFPKVKKEKETTQVFKYFTIKINGVYLYRMLKYGGYRYSSYSPVKKYKTLKEAQRVVKKMNKKYSSHNFETEEVQAEHGVWI